jgi:Fic family protein
MATQTANWPAVTFESLEWTSREDLQASRAARRRANGSYRAAVLPGIADLTVSLPSSVVSESNDASNEIARFDAEAGAEIAPFASILLRTESAASSKIENLTASARAIAEADLGHGSRNAALIVANQRAMTAAINLADQLDGESILDMHNALLGTTFPAIAGKWRSEQVWIGGSNTSPHGAPFVPPHHRHVPGAIEDLVRFIKRTDIPTLVHAAITHAHFETIHPFPDGNGRVGRAIVHAQLRHAHLTQHVTVPVSAGLLSDLDAYFGALEAYRLGDLVPIVERFTQATFSALMNGQQLTADLRSLRESWNNRIEARRDSAAWKITALVVRNPVVNAPLISRELGVPVTSVYRLIQPLVDAGVLVEFTNKKRNKLWRAPEILDVLDAFAARAERRQPVK